jgi:hypothetical protein
MIGIREFTIRTGDKEQAHRRFHGDGAIKGQSTRFTYHSYLATAFVMHD